MTLEDIDDVTVTGFEAPKIDLILENKKQDTIRYSSEHIGDEES